MMLSDKKQKENKGFLDVPNIMLDNKNNNQTNKHPKRSRIERNRSSSCSKSKLTS